MITRIYIDNFRCLTNFEIKPEAFQLWMGANGSGKTSTFDALRSIQLLMSGLHVGDVFNIGNLTFWDVRQEQRFAFSLLINNEPYNYEIIIEYSHQSGQIRIKREELKKNQITFFYFDGSEAHLYNLLNTGNIHENVCFPADPRRSAIPTIAPSGYNDPLFLFRENVGNWLFLHPVPSVVTQMANSEARTLSLYGENFAQWYRHVLQEHPGIGFGAKKLLADVLPGFDQLSLKDTGEARRLTATFRIHEEDFDFDFLNLSDGQRQLIVLYTVLESLNKGIFSTLFIDEPDNFISLREIRPWLDNLEEICEETEKQAILISHHPEIINTMARGEELWFSRQEGAHVRVSSFPETPELTPAETMARGWEDE